MKSGSSRRETTTPVGFRAVSFMASSGSEASRIGIRFRDFASAKPSFVPAIYMV